MEDNLEKIDNKIIKENNKIFNYKNKYNNKKFNLINDSYNSCILDNTFTAFKSFDNILYLIYANKNRSIIFYNLIDNIKINEIKRAHKTYITNFRNYFDKNNKRDLVISISAIDNNLKLWNINNFECLINIKNINKNGFLNSACFLYDNNQIYIITSNFYYYSFEPIKIFDFNGNKIKEINDSKEKTYSIYSYYDNKLSKSFIITCNIGYVKSYDYYENKLYHKYYDNNKRLHYSLTIHSNEENVELIESCYDGNIRIWDFHSGDLLKKIKVSDNALNSIFLSNNDYLFIGCDEKKIKLIDLKNGLIKDLFNYNQKITTIKVITHPQYGECLLSQGSESNQIKFWIFNI